ncbi:cystine/glutamate transporter-like [Strongylocentrotus purpuratus]|uniref:Cystine/glutamate transporter n=1 Tax=Strongylocentrotus purpuratus TaxID=7668 RepID=A0A7M7N5D0_STRPU|nr:cystine/glutamate transporter-like [Strongylocentrotus purpuratus]
MAQPMHNPANSQSGDNDEKRGNGDKVYLRRQLTVIDGIALTVGIIIGSGIFISPAGILRYTGSIGWSLIMWIFCGLLSTLGALSYAELATSFPVSGGDYSYLLMSFGPIPAFLRMYTQIVASFSGSNTVLALAASYYIVLPFFPDCEVSYKITTLMAASLLCLTSIVNCFSIPLTRGLNILLTICKVLGLIVIIGFGVAEIAKGNTGNLSNTFTSPALFSTFPLAVYSGLFAYSGWQNLMYITEEVVNPSKTVPLSISISMVFVTVIYLLVNITYFLILSEDEILTSNAIALDLGRRVMGRWWWTLSLVVAMSITGSLNGGYLARSRFFYVASREGHIPEIASMMHVNRKTPLPAAAISVPISLMMLVSNDVNTLINYISFSDWLFSGMACLVVPYYRWKRPELKRPFKVPLVVPILFSLCSFFVVGMSLYSSPVDCAIGLAITLTGIPVYLIGVWWQNKPSWINKGLDTMTIFLQQLLYVVPQEDIEL